MHQKRLAYSYITCTKCGKEIRIHRRKSRTRSEGHRKHNWCVNCKKRTLHIESKKEKAKVQPYEVNVRVNQALEEIMKLKYGEE